MKQLIQNVLYMFHRKQSSTKNSHDEFANPPVDVQVGDSPHPVTKRIKSYARLMRLDRPIGIWLCLLPALWEIFMANPEHQLIFILVNFFLASILLRGAGCTINDIVDRHLDARVVRTISRPLAAKEVSVREAIIFAVAQITAGILIVSLISINAALFILFSIPFIIAYPYMKRITYWPQAWLGMTFNLFGLAGWIACAGHITLPGLLIYGGAILWTIGYDTQYAHQDKVDDKVAGMKSTALLFADRSKILVSLCYIGMIVLIMAAGAKVHMNWLFYFVLICASIQLFWQVVTWEMDNPDDCKRKFVSNQIFGLIVLVAIIIGNLNL